MASDKEYLDFILDQISDLEDVTYRKMMGEYILYYRDKIFGGIYDNRFLVKVTKASLSMIPSAKRERPYEGAKEMLLIEDIENKKFLQKLIKAMYNELPFRNKKN